MAAFETMGTTLENSIANYSQSISSALISSLSPVLLTACTLYFTLKGWMFLTGRAHGAVADTVISAFKISLVAMVGLNTGNFVSMGIGFIDGAESILLSALPGSASSAWDAIDNLWAQIAEAGTSFIGAFNNISSFTEGVGYTFLMALLMLLFLIAAAFLTLASLGVIIVSKITLVIVLGFGPLFICMLMFPLTRTWFDGWLKFCLTLVFTIVMMTALLSLVSEVFGDRLTQLNEHLSNGMSSGNAGELIVGTFTFCIVCVALATLVKSVPGMASAVTGGVGLSAIGLGAMLTGVGTGAVRKAHAAAVTGVAAKTSVMAASSATMRAGRALKAAALGA